ncbi:MAG TPA: tRNA pseudouridine(55) synthase TruB [Chromatiales bacterium]|nr:tRNA pseudouridine(55) synthase TruB [Chromatiales bacterium]
MSAPRKKTWRQLHGIVLLDKAKGLSSNHALQQVRRLFQAEKAGHTGSLDPLATGLLPVCFGKATRVSGLLLDADKSYSVCALLGQRTDTADADGEVIEERPVPPLELAQVEAVVARFVGEVDQVPPMYSALKHKGQRLYELARKGIEVERPARRVRFDRITIDRLEGSEGSELCLSLRCSKGAYVRTLVEDIGEALGCGAHVTMLRRTGLGPFMDQPLMYTFDELQKLAEGGQDALDRVILPTDSALTGYPAISLDADSTFRIRHGHPVFVAHAPTEGWFRIYGADGLFLGLGEVLDDGRVAPRRLLAAL